MGLGQNKSFLSDAYCIVVVSNPFSVPLDGDEVS